jgi:hypothetical protein
MRALPARVILDLAQPPRLPFGSPDIARVVGFVHLKCAVTPHLADEMVTDVAARANYRGFSRNAFRLYPLRYPLHVWMRWALPSKAMVIVSSRLPWGSKAVPPNFSVSGRRTFAPRDAVNTSP